VRQPTHQRFLIGDSADVGAARRRVRELAQALHASEDQTGRVELIVTELANNLFRHAKPGGAILLRPVPPVGVEVIAVDRGPGIVDLDAALAGQVATPDGLGCGLAAVRRASSRFDAYTSPGRGTVVASAVDLRAAPVPASHGHRVAGVSIGLDEVCGDAWAVADLDGSVSVAVVDGVGHGVYAAAAADAALRTFALAPDDIEEFLFRAHFAMRETRGAAVAVCRLDPRQGSLRYASVGNVSGRIFAGGETRGLVSYNGTVGLHAKPPTVRLTSYPWSPGATLVLWTDGLSRRLDLEADPDLLARDPAVVAGVLHRDYGRERDDATVVVVSYQAAP